MLHASLLIEPSYCSLLKIAPIYINEKLLIEKAAKGDREAQHRLYEKHSPKMLGVCRRYIKDVQFAEDVMVNGFMKVFTNLKNFRHQGSFEGWIRRIMIRESISYLRKNQFVVYDQDLIERIPPRATADAFSWDTQYIQTLIDGLPDGYRAVFVLYAIEGYAHRDIADMLDITTSTSKSQLFKARRLLQEQLNKQNIIGYGTQ